jgi:phage-related protein (TIGR01555 family)
MERRADNAVINHLTGLGMSGGKESGGRPNPTVIPLLADELRSLYANSGISRRICDLLPQKACRKGWTVPEIGDEDRRLRTWAKVSEAMSLARLYGGSALLMVTEDDVPPLYRDRPELWRQQPLDLRRVRRLVAIHAFDAFEAHPVQFERNVMSPNFRQPSMWAISTDGFSGFVHGSRICWFRGTRNPPSESHGGWYAATGMPDASALQSVWDEIRRLTETWQAGAVMAQELRYSVLKLNQLAEYATSNEGPSQLAERMSLIQGFQSAFGFTVVGKDDSYDVRNAPPTGFKDLTDVQQEALLSCLGWTRSMWMGESPGALGSGDESGLERERQIVSGYQEDNREPLEQLYSVVLAQRDGPTRGVVPEGWSLTFLPLSEPSATEVATLRKTVAETDAIYVGLNVIAPEDLTRYRFGADGWQMDLPELSIPDPADAEQEAALQAEVDRLAAGADDVGPDAGSGAEE